MTDPTQMVPAADGPGGPDDPPMDRRIVAIIVLAVIIVLLALLLLVVSLGDDGDDAAPEGTTTTTSTTEPTSTTDTSTTSTSTTAATTTTTTSTTMSTTTTTATTAPPPTIAPSRCTGATGPTEPEPVAEVFYDAWRIDDLDCAEDIADQDAIDTLFALDGTDARWTFQGCSTIEDPDPTIDCAFTYEGGSAHFEMQYGAIAGWRIVDVYFVAD